jgi:4-hydroxybenzoate polyprenyltransferase
MTSDTRNDRRTIALPPGEASGAPSPVGAMGFAARYLELIRFSHTLFALPFAMLAAVMAWSRPAAGFASTSFGWRPLVGILLCMVLARGAAMAFNRLVDRKWDAANPRTRSRHLPAGLLSTGGVALFAAVSGAGFVASTLLFLPNVLPLCLSLPVLAFLLAYSYTKRFTPLSHVWLGASLMLAPVSAWIAIRGEYLVGNPADILPALVLGGAVLFWVSGFDIIYACQDFAFDRAAGLRSVPAAVGVRGALWIAAGCHAAMVAVLATLPWLFPPWGWLFACGVAAVAVLLIYEHAIVRHDDLSRVNEAFFHVNAIVGLGLFLVGSIDAWW